MSKRRIHPCPTCGKGIDHTSNQCRACESKARTKPISERFWPKVKMDLPENCWEWQGGKYSNGYGAFSKGGRLGNTPAHRVAYELGHGAIPEGLTIDHLCKNIICVNPAHLEAVTQKENLMRSNGRCPINAKKVTCVNGHPFSGKNILGNRICHTCGAERARKYRAEKRQKAQLF